MKGPENANTKPVPTYILPAPVCRTADSCGAAKGFGNRPSRTTQVAAYQTLEAINSAALWSGSRLAGATKRQGTSDYISDGAINHGFRPFQPRAAQTLDVTARPACATSQAA